MRRFPIPTVVVSKCITFEPVRWNGQVIASDIVEKLKPFVIFVPVCPEVEIGLGVPRDPVRIVMVNGERRLIQPSTGLDVTDRMLSFSERFLDSLREVDGFLLKSGSPSSGFRNVKIYPTSEKSASIARGAGFFGGAVLERFSNLAIEDEKRLLNSRIREHFLTKLFTLASFREAKKSGSIQRLVRFQSENKLLLTTYSQKELRILGRATANQDSKCLTETSNFYEAHLQYALKRPPSVGSNVNVMMKAMGYFSAQLSREEKMFFLEALERYKTGGLSLSPVLAVLKSWMIRFRQRYLLSQTFFEPYPADLADFRIADAEYRSRDYWG